MSLKQVVANSGIRHFVAVNSLSSNWVISSRALQGLDLDPQPVRVGAKRVVLAVNREHHSPRKAKLMVVLIAAVGGILITAHLLTNGSARHATATPASCSNLALTQISFDHSLKATWQDWSLDFEFAGENGNVTRFSYIATCRTKTEKGYAYATVQGSIFQIKQMASSKR